jgi:hypothetical protein
MFNKILMFIHRHKSKKYIIKAQVAKLKSKKQAKKICFCIIKKYKVIVYHYKKIMKY